jgi:hypothetical protein
MKIQPASNAPAMSYRQSERYITLDGVYPRLLIAADGGDADVLNKGLVHDATGRVSDQPPEPEAPLQVAEAASAVRLAEVGIPESVQTMHARLRVTELKLEQRIAALANEIDQASRGNVAFRVALRTEFALPRVVVRFDDNSAEPDIDDAVLRRLGAVARAANRIYLQAY